MKISDNGLQFTAVWEAFQPKAYRATPNEKYLTIGFGHYGQDVKDGATITKDEAMALLRQDMAKAEGYANKYCKPGAFNQAQFDAICDCLFNVGAGYLERPEMRGNLYKGIVGGDCAVVRKSIGSFKFQSGKVLPGLVRRCAGRQALFDGSGWEMAEKLGRSAV